MALLGEKVTRSLLHPFGKRSATADSDSAGHHHHHYDLRLTYVTPRIVISASPHINEVRYVKADLSGHSTSNPSFLIAPTWNRQALLTKYSSHIKFYIITSDWDVSATPAAADNHRPDSMSSHFHQQTETFPAVTSCEVCAMEMLADFSQSVDDFLKEGTENIIAVLCGSGQVSGDWED